MKHLEDLKWNQVQYEHQLETNVTNIDSNHYTIANDVPFHIAIDLIKLHNKSLDETKEILIAELNHALYCIYDKEW